MDLETKVKQDDDKSSVADKGTTSDCSADLDDEEEVSGAKVEYVDPPIGENEYVDPVLEDKGSPVIPNVVGDESLQEELQVEIVGTELLVGDTQTTVEMSKFIEPPAFVSDTKSYAEYKADLKRWSRICGLDKSVQAEMVVYRLQTGCVR